MNARELFRAGKLDEAIDALGMEVRDNPLDAQRRTFLFELLCFAGEYDRAAKHLDVLGDGGAQAGLGMLLYRSALHAEHVRKDVFRGGTLPSAAPAAERAISGSINGKRFDSLVDADPRVGPRFELFAAGQYTLLPLDQIESVTMQAPTRLRDLLWSPAVVRTGPRFEGLELGEVLLPVLSPESSEDSDDAVRLGRVTEWVALDGAEVPIGQRLLLVDGQEFPILELRELRIDQPSEAGA